MAATDILASSALGLASAGAQQVFTDYNREEDFRNYQLSQRENYHNAQNMQYNAPLMTKLGMAAAGLNPNTMSNPSPATPNAAPLGVHASPELNIAQDNNLMADARLKNAEAEKTELQNDQIKGENESSFENYRQGLETLAKLYKEKGWNDMAESISEEIGNLNALKDEGKLNFNAGNLRGAVNAYTTLDNMQERLSNTFKHVLDTETNYKMLQNGSSTPLSKMPKIQRDLLATQVANNIATHAVLLTQKELNNEQKNELNKLQEKLQADIDKAVAEKQLTEYQARSIYLADWKQLLNDKEFMAAALAKADENQKILLQQAGQFVNAVVTAKTGGKIANSINNVGQSKGNSTTTTRSYHYDSKGKMKGYDVNQSQGSNTMLKRSIPSVDEQNLTW